MTGQSGGEGPLAGATLYMVEVRAEQWERLCAFYGDTLGIPRRMLDTEGRFAMYGQREPFVAVVGRGPVGRSRSRVVIDLVVPDLDGALRALASRGVRPASGPTESPEGYRLARIEDPEGNEIHLFEWTSGEPRP